MNYREQAEKIRVGDLLHDRDCDKFSERGVCSCGAVARAVKDAASSGESSPREET
jgi:hypothetical protein